MAWSIVSAASRMCVDLGWHRLPKFVEGHGEEEISTPMKLFWHIYVLDRGMAFTLGRPPSIYEFDIATERSHISRYEHTALGQYVSALQHMPLLTCVRVFYGIGECADVVGEMHIQLFSAAAQRDSPQNRIASAKALASRLTRSNIELKQVLSLANISISQSYTDTLRPFATKCRPTIALGMPTICLTL